MRALIGRYRVTALTPTMGSLPGLVLRGALIVAAAALLAAGLAAAVHFSTDRKPFRVMAVGDIACDPAEPAFADGEGTSAGCRQKAVGQAIMSQDPDAFLALGDLQYYDGTYEKFMQSYHPALGALLPITRPIPGNHEYKTPGGEGFYRYFGAAAHRESGGTYSFDAGDWHVLAINSMHCTPSRPCGPGSPMADWIAADVAASPSSCLMAMWHHPVWSAGAHGDYTPMAAVWNQLDSYGADVVLTGHDHLYQRFKPVGQGSVGPDGSMVDPLAVESGITGFVLGTGGENNYKASGLDKPTMAAALAGVGTNPDPAVFGALRMDLRADGMDYAFVPAAGTTFTDSGSLTCRPKTPPTSPPSPAE